MTKVKIFPLITKQPVYIEFWGSDRIGNDVEYNYITSDMSDDEQVLKVFISESDLLKFIDDFELNETAMQNDEFLLDAFDEVKDLYWSEVLFVRLSLKSNQKLRRAV